MPSKPSAAQSPLVLAVGKEQVLVGRVIAQVVQATRKVDPNTVRTDITASDPRDKDMLFDPMEDKVYRHPTFYQLPASVDHM